MTARHYLGLDLGSVSLDAVVIDESATVLWSAYRTVRGRSRDAVISLCGELLEGWLRPRSASSSARRATAWWRPTRYTSPCGGHSLVRLSIVEIVAAYRGH